MASTWHFVKKKFKQWEMILGGYIHEIGTAKMPASFTSKSQNFDFNRCRDLAWRVDSSLLWVLLSVYYHHTGRFYYWLCSHPVAEPVYAGLFFFLLVSKLFRFPDRYQVLCSRALTLYYVIFKIIGSTVCLQGACKC